MQQKIPEFKRETVPQCQDSVERTPASCKGCLNLMLLLIFLLLTDRSRGHVHSCHAKRINLAEVMPRITVFESIFTGYCRRMKVNTKFLGLGTWTILHILPGLDSSKKFSQTHVAFLIGHCAWVFFFFFVCFGVDVSDFWEVITPRL